MEIEDKFKVRKTKIRIFLEQEFSNMKKKILLLHGTSHAGLEGITLSHRIIPQGSNTWLPKDKTHVLGKVFLTDDIPKATYHGQNGIDWTAVYNYGDAQIILQVEVSTDSLLPDLYEMPEAKSWTESLKKVNSVCIEGEIQRSQIKSVLFYDYDKHEEPLFRASLEDWHIEYKKHEDIFWKFGDKDTRQEALEGRTEFLKQLSQKTNNNVKSCYK